MNKEELKKYIDKLINPKILIIGDFALDEMVYGNTERISREAPVLILEHYETKKILGAASNAAHNVSKLNRGKASAIGVYGDDYHAPILLKAFKKANINTTFMVQDKTRPTTTKTRISGFSTQSVRQQIVRIDREMNEPVNKKTENKIINNIKKAIPKYDAVILSDYNIGMMTDDIIQCAIETAKKEEKIVVVDAQSDLGRFKNATCLTPNQPDTEKAVGYFIDSYDKAIKAGADLINITNADMMLLTRGDEGMIVFHNGKHFSVEAFNKTDVFDVTGAGDTVTASFTLALAMHSSFSLSIKGSISSKDVFLAHLFRFWIILNRAYFYQLHKLIYMPIFELPRNILCNHPIIN